MEGGDEGVRSYRELLRYVLQEYQTRGGKLIYPVGCYHLEDWLLDGLNVPKLLRCLQTEREVSLVKVCEGEAGVQSIKSLTLNPPGPLAQGLNSGNLSQEENQVKRANSQNQHLSDLHLILPETGMTEEHLQWLAYTLYIGSCSSYTSESLTDAVREQLQISPTSAESLYSLLAEAADMQSQAASSLEMITVLLQISRPQYFQDFKAFSIWQKAAISAVCQSLILGASEPSQDRRGREKSSLRPELMRLKMYARMVDVPTSEEFDEDVYSEAVNLFTRAASNVANSSGLGWSLPWAIKVRVAELLMAAGFTSGNGQPLAEQNQLNYVLRHHLWPLLSLPLNLHDCLHAWAYFKIFSVTGNTDLLAKGRELMEAIPRRQNGNMNGSSKKLQDPDGFIDNTVKAIVDWVALRLSRYRQLADAAPIPSLLGLLISCQRYLNLGSLDTAEVLEKCIHTSIQSEFDRSLQDLRESIEGVPKDGDWIVQVAECCSDLLDEEVSYYSPMFSGVLSRPHEIAAQQIHTCFNEYLLPFLQTVHILDDENLEAIRASVKLESRLQTLLGGNISNGHDWAILERLTPLLHLWVSNQLQLLDQWYVRILAAEDWSPLNPGGGPARSTPELARIAREMLEALFNLHLGIPEEVVNAACQGLDDFFQRYARDIASPFHSPDFFVPPIPGLTRYKKDVKDKAVALDAKQRPRLDSGSLQKFVGPEQEYLGGISITSLLVRANSVEETRRNLSEFCQVLYDRYDTPDGQDGLWAERMFDGTRHALSRSKDIVLKFASVKVVFQEMEKDLSGVYKHSVGEARIQPLLDALNEKLILLVGLIDEDLRDDLAVHLLQALVDAFLRILLHGGSTRFFRPNDVPLIEEDLNSLKHLFFQGGDGIPMEDIETKCVDIDDLLGVLAMDTLQLINNLKQVKQQEKMGGLQGRQPIEFDSQILLPILAHREDHAASKYLKKEYQLPKKLENGSGLPFGSKNSGGNLVPPKKSKLNFGFKRSGN